MRSIIIEKITGSLIIVHEDETHYALLTDCHEIALKEKKIFIVTDRNGNKHKLNPEHIVDIFEQQESIKEKEEDFLDKTDQS